MEFPELRQDLIAITHELFSAGLITPTGGNVSVRLPDNTGILITPTSSFKGALRPEDIVKVDYAGNACDAEQRPSVETRLHLQVYALRKKVKAVIHTHPPLATILALCRIPIPPITIDAAPFVNIPIIPFALSGTPEELENLTQHLANAPAALLQNHGLLTLGRDVRQAADRALTLEQVARMVLWTRLLGVEPQLLPEREAALLYKVLGS